MRKQMMVYRICFSSEPQSYDVHWLNANQIKYSYLYTACCDQSWGQVDIHLVVCDQEERRGQDQGEEEGQEGEDIGLEQNTPGQRCQSQKLSTK